MEGFEGSGADWQPQRERVDAALFTQRTIGPYKLGRRLRAVPYGQVTLAIHDGFEEVVELEQYDDLVRTEFAGPEGALLGDISSAIGLSHRYLIPLIGAGMDGGVPYVVRAHRLGRPLGEVLRQLGSLPAPHAAAVLYPLAEVLAYLADEGAQPGACSPGGFDVQDVLLGYDGSVALLGSGLKLLRCPAGDPLACDFESLLSLAAELDRRAGTRFLPMVQEAGSPAEAALALRRAERKALGQGPALLGAYLRRHYEEAIREERAFFDLPTLH